MLFWDKILEIFCSPFDFKQPQDCTPCNKDVPLIFTMVPQSHLHSHKTLLSFRSWLSFITNNFPNFFPSKSILLFCPVFILCSLFKHPQLLVFPDFKSLIETSTVLPQSHLHFHITDLELSLFSVGAIAVNFPNFSLVISILFLHPQDFITPRFKESPFAIMIFPQSHWHFQVTFLLLVPSLSKTVKSLNFCPVMSISFGILIFSFTGK